MSKLYPPFRSSLFYVVFSLLFLRLAVNATAQCPPSNQGFLFSNQADIDNFGIAYANCTDITLLMVEIKGPDLTDLSPLANIKKITGTLEIVGTSVSTLTGLSGLTEIGSDLKIYHHYDGQLEVIDGFPKLTKVGRYLAIQLNENLKKIKGFPVLTEVGDILDIYENTGLTEVDAFPALLTTGHLNIRVNRDLEAVDGFESLAEVKHQFNIENNRKLKSVTGFGDLSIVGSISAGDYLRFNDNTALTEISGFGSLTTIKGFLQIRNSPDLTAMSGFGSLASVREFAIQNTGLTHLTNFSALTTLGGSRLAIEENRQLTDISGLQHINPTGIGGGAGLYITGNEELSVCYLPNFCAYLAGSGARTISGNKENCLNEQAVTDACNSLSLLPGSTNTLYVNTNVSASWGKGDSWSSAIPQLADALKWAKQQYDANNTVFDANPLKIYVAKGTYKPLYRADNLDGLQSEDVDNSFVLVKNVHLYGGFSGNETALEQRNYSANPTILSGDIDAEPGLSADDARHVVIAAGEVGSALLDGFTVSGGYFDSGDNGGQLMVKGIAVRHERGSGLSLVNASPQVRNTIFTGNRGYAGVVSHTNSKATFVNTLFTGNTVTYGTVYSTSSSPVLVNCTISGNTGADNAGNGVAMRNVTASTPKIYNTIIWGNLSADGQVNTVVNSTGGNASTPEYQYSLVQGITDASNGNLTGDTNPMFADASQGDYRPEPGSPVINSGDNTRFAGLETASRDLAGNPRLLRHHIDLGAYESDCSGSVLVSYAEAGGLLIGGENHLYNSCTPLAVVNPANPGGYLTVSATSADDLISHDNIRYVGRYYDVSAENPGNTEVTLFFTKADFDHYNSTFGDAHNASLPEHLRVARYSDTYAVTGSALSSETKPSFIHTQTVQWNETLELWEVTFTTPGFSGFFITGQSDDALPVTLVDFTATSEEQSVLLQWKTSLEINASRYEIERSSDSKQWRSIGEVAAAGESGALLAYRYRDSFSLPGLSYYRLKMIDQDGSHAYSDIRSVRKGNHDNETMLAYPNPATNRVYLDVDAEIADVLLRDITGRLVKKVRYQKGAGVSLDDLSVGMLLIEVQLADGTTRTARVVVQP